jgi:hypothetical protein
MQYIHYCARLRFYPLPVRSGKPDLPRKGTSRCASALPELKGKRLFVVLCGYPYKNQRGYIEKSPLNRKERLLFPSLPGTNRATFAAVRSRISQPFWAANVAFAIRVCSQLTLKSSSQCASRHKASLNAALSLVYLPFSPWNTCFKSAPFQAKALAPILPITGRHSLFETSSALYAINSLHRVFTYF